MQKYVLSAYKSRLSVGSSEPGPSGSLPVRSPLVQLVCNIGCATAKMPFYKYNSFTGSIKPSTKFQPLYPISPLPLQQAEPVMIYDTIKTKPLTITPKSGYCTDKPATLDAKVWGRFKHFQSVIDKPVYLAGGRKDKILFGLTVAYVGVCTLQSLVFVAKECLNII